MRILVIISRQPYQPRRDIRRGRKIIFHDFKPAHCRASTTWTQPCPPECGVILFYWVTLNGSFSFQPSAMFPPQFTRSALMVPLQKISRLHNFKTVKASPHQGAKILLVQRQKRIGKRKRREKNRSVFCWRKDNWLIHHILVSHQPQIGFQPMPVGHGLLSQRPNVGSHLVHHISTGQKRPILMFVNIENPP